MKASALSFRAAVVFVVAGMIWGLVMGISEDHTTLAVYAHLNLLGWVSLFLFGIYYHLHPSLEDSTGAMIQADPWVSPGFSWGVGRFWLLCPPKAQSMRELQTLPVPFKPSSSCE